MASKEEMLQKAKDRGYNLTMGSGNNNWFSLYSERHKLNLQLWVGTEEFELTHGVKQSIVQITTTKCGSFMNDEHFNRIERQIRKVLFDLL